MVEVDRTGVVRNTGELWSGGQEQLGQEYRSSAVRLTGIVWSERHEECDQGD